MHACISKLIIKKNMKEIDCIEGIILCKLSSHCKAYIK